ncbi:YgfZ/GcvT domain-containing protein [Hahella ganghwensis]|uniref:CAF17-like 4Fe-4S cluster assembly/insertion protein YgfZ n=1 Tax=Hahella ganghwensis TaxID=286420 RepID=UPI0003818239|nr:folate-binding protein YgfZ [Hahella ganghwensis]
MPATLFWNSIDAIWNSEETNQNGPSLYPLKSYQLISVTGPDAEKFMQGQFTCDLKQITPTQSSLGACCNNKGRMIAQFRVINVAPEKYLLRCPEGVADSLNQHLAKFKVFYKCELKVEEDIGVLGLCGDEDVLSQLLGTLPTEANAAEQVKGLSVVRVPGDQPRFELYADTESALQQLPDLISNLCLGEESEWELQDVRAGLGEVYPDTQEEFIPQMQNLQFLDGVSFKKGCYTGQEIVARMQYLGKLKKRMYLMAIDGGHARAGDSLIGEGEKVIGTIVRSADNTLDQQLALAVVDNSHVEAGEPLQLKDQPNSRCHLRELPYHVEQNTNTRPSR